MADDRTPVTRQALLDMMVTVRKTHILRAGVELGVFDILASGTSTAEAVAGKLGTDPRATRVLLNALAAIGLLDATDGGYLLAPGADTLLVADSPEYYGHAFRLAASDYEWDALRHLPEAVRTGGTVVDDNAESPDFGYWLDFAVAGTGNTQPMADLIAEEVTTWAAGRDTLDVLDVACGHGLYGFTIAQRDPRARVWSLDWPNVLSITAANAERLGVTDRSAQIPGDMFTAPLGGPYDVIAVTNVLHHFSHERAVELLARMRGALKPDGRLVTVAITHAGGPPAEDPVPHLFAVLMLAWTHSGEVTSAEEVAEIVAEAGFDTPSQHSLPHIPLRTFIADRRNES
ncbi:O-methyltransferase [Longispora fulva]|uniref:C-methyltransferase n=1 Tax=Longispora fulva TaxID=619741 RepID=A0A8J7G5U6_9ACTN|nr:methyltransferase [Longispora fulva]MBG6134223.1 C-methyltransferase [Longispora fulva]GIG63115.1 O-methyltransferase [Longispora fulva]